MPKIDFNALNLKISPLKGGSVIDMGEFNLTDLNNFQMIQNDGRQTQSTITTPTLPPVATSAPTEDI